MKALLKKLQEHRQYKKYYNQTVKELSHLTDRDFADIGFSRFDVHEIAHKTAKEKVG